ncbi:MAG: division/cell wall cluster transcriptional repressor MraZ, partial [Acidobacteriota bacterium]
LLSLGKGGLVMFRGNFPAKMDAQGRIKIPTAHRKILEDFGSEVYVTSLDGESVRIYPMHEWEKIEARLLEPPKMLPGKVKFMRNTSYYGQVSKMDKQGRVSIQSHLRERAGVEHEEVAVMGQLNYLEVWNRERFQRLLESDPFTEKDALALAEMNI